MKITYSVHGLTEGVKDKYAEALVKEARNDIQREGADSARASILQSGTEGA